MKKIITLWLSILLLLTMFPTTVFASHNNTEMQTIANEEQTVLSEDTKEIEILPPEESHVELSASSLYVTNYVQTRINYPDVTITLPEYSSIMNKTSADSVKVTAQIIYKGVITSSISESVTLTNLAEKNGIFQMNFANYGKFTVGTKYYKGSKLVYTVPKKTVTVLAEEYNIVPVNASFPVLYLGLSFDEISKKPNGDPIPTIVVLSRPDTFNWDKLPKNVYALPYLTQKQVRSKNGLSMAAKVRNQMSTYVKDLYALNKSSKFNLFVTDNHISHLLSVFTKNRIPENQTTIIQLSDGVGTYGWFNSTYNVPNPQTKYDEMAKIWQKLKADVWKNKKVPNLKKIKYSVSSNSTSLSAYSFVVATDPDVKTQWWLARKAVFSNPDSVFLNSLINNPVVVQKPINDLLNALKAKGATAITQFKELYNFEDNFFSEATRQNKKIMVFLGTYTQNEHHFDEYARFVIALYGDDYVYYYKGHPNTPTGLDAAKAKRLKDLALIDVDSSIPAELLLFFYPGLYLSGYTSTTFDAVINPEMSCVFFNYTKTVGLGANGGNFMDYFASPVSGVNISGGVITQKVKNLCLEGENNYKGYYLIEFKGTGNNDIAIWNANDSTITYYKDNSGTYDFVKKEDSVKDRDITTTNEKYSISVGGSAIGLNPQTIGVASFTYSSNNKKIATVSSTGKVTGKAIGTTTITITAKATGFYKTSKKTVTITVGPKKQSIQSLSSTSKNSLSIKWKKDTKVSGYEINIASNSAFTLDARQSILYKNSSTLLKYTQLPNGERYYARVRSYKIVSGEKIYGSWSNVRTITIK